MRNQTYLLSFWVLLAGPSFIMAQSNNLPIGQWRAVLPYNTGLAVAQSNDHVYYATQQSLLQVDKTDLSPRFFSRVDGLSDNGISKMAYSAELKTLVIGYASGNIDLLNSAGVVNIPDIANNLSITGDKGIYDVYLLEDSLAIISCGFGIVQLDLTSKLFKRTVFTGLKVFQTTLFEGAWYAATEDGLYRMPTSGFFQNFLEWEKLGTGVGLPDSYVSAGIASAHQKLYFAVNDTLKSLSGNNLETVLYKANHKIRFVESHRDHILAGYLPKDGGGGTLFVQPPTGLYTTVNGDCIGRITGAVLDQQDRIWLSDEWLAFRRINANGTACEKLTYNSPFGFTSSEIRILEDSVYIASGTISVNGSGTGNGSGIYVNKAGDWLNYNFINYPQLQAWEANVDYNTVDVDPRDGTIYAGSYYGGLLEIKNGQLTIFQDQNSALQGAVGDLLRERVAGLVRDQNGHLWIANTSAPDPLVLFTADRQWASFRPTGNTNLLKGIVDQQNNKWFILGSGGIMVYNEGNDLLSAFDDKVRVFDAGSGNLPSAKVVSVGLDLDGAVWVGTDDGVGVIRCGDVFNTSLCRASRIIVTQEGIPEALLNDEEIRAIMVDGANRKWLGTRNGLFVQSADGLTEVARYSTDNSPLLDKQINTLAFNPKNGEMWVGTEKGIMVYQTDAPVGGEVHAEEVSVYPNPVRPDYRGPIAIKGLPRDGNVKITDIRGRLVFETTALGGQAIWYGEDYTGRRAASGVYLVFSTSEAVDFGTPDKAVSKIVFLN
ncbi:MAG: hypothetical protein KA479_05370 [Saprospiraceae bacterium]|nr:hypothetical protein [Saprospiraceae bacterium]